MQRDLLAGSESFGLSGVSLAHGPWETFGSRLAGDLFFPPARLVGSSDRATYRLLLVYVQAPRTNGSFVFVVCCFAMGGGGGGSAEDRLDET